MSPSLASGILVSALLRRVNDAGGIGMVRAKGDPDSGAILLILNEKPGETRLVERVAMPDMPPELQAAGPPGQLAPAEIESYWHRRRARDPDLWVIELDIALAQRFAAETICGG